MIYYKEKMGKRNYSKFNYAHTALTKSFQAVQALFIVDVQCDTHAMW